MTDTAPFFADMADGPQGGRAWWVEASDGVRLRLGVWQVPAAKGTVFLFPGRTEYIEKYGRSARDLARHGFATYVIDWRGQGLSDRLVGDAMAGHVHHFADYQLDVQAMLDAAQAADLPKPWHLLGHSMGGCIGLRAAMDGMPVASAAFSGPMWGIRMAEALRPVAWSLSWGGKQLGLGHIYAPGTTSGSSYVLSEPFDTNKLTRDREMYGYMASHLQAHPELCLGGPSLQWLHEALRETLALSRLPAPAMPGLTILGSDEDIVDIPRIRQRMETWPGGRLEVIPGGLHEVLMEDAATRARVFEVIFAFYDDACRQPLSAKAAAAL